ncbi:MAG: hypothetical protein QXX51_01925 [Candidatus Bathyarchaeia archaeon]
MPDEQYSFILSSNLLRVPEGGKYISHNVINQLVIKTAGAKNYGKL